MSSLPLPSEPHRETATSFLKLLVPVTALHFVGELRELQELPSGINWHSDDGGSRFRTYISACANYLRGSAEREQAKAHVVEAFNGTIANNLAPYPESDWIAMSDLCRRYVLIQRIFEEGCHQTALLATTGYGIPPADFAEIITALLVGSEETQNAFYLAMMHQLSHRSADTRHRSALGKALAHSPEARRLLLDQLLLPLAAFMPKRAVELLALT
jgi:hypothetical protein